MWKIMPGQQQRGAQFEHRAPAGLSELEGDERGVDAESEPARRERAMERDTEELNAALGRRRRQP